MKPGFEDEDSPGSRMLGGSAIRRCLGILPILGLCCLLFRRRLEVWGVAKPLQAVALDAHAFCVWPETQWLVYLFLAFLFVLATVATAIFSKERDGHSGFLWMLIAMSTYGYVSHYKNLGQSTQALALLAGILFGKLAVILNKGLAKRDFSLKFSNALVVFILVLVVAVPTSTTRESRTFEYRGYTRWAGPWGNPNICGLIMGVGTVVACGYFVWLVSSHLRKHTVKRDSALKNVFAILVSLITVILFGLGLFKTFSRGAWLATFCGVCYVLLCLSFVIDFESSSKAQTKRIKSNWLVIAIIMVLLLSFCFWEFRFTEWRLGRRLYSMANVNDFSWRNRVAAWDGAIRMIGHHSWLGWGWGTAESVYDRVFRPPQLENSGAVQTNDLFILGISAGMPALICFLTYVGLSLRGPRSIRLRDASARQAVQAPRPLDPSSTVRCLQLASGPDIGLGVEGRGSREQIELEWLQATCRAGAIVLLVGFFFDGGLFKLATGSVFWILLELGRVDVYRKDPEAQKAEIPIAAVQTPVRDHTETGAQGSAFANASVRLADAPYRRKRWEVWLRRSAWILGVAAVSESAILLATPLFGVNNTTLAISRHYLVPPSAVADLNLLATNVDWSSRKLRPLLQHSSLANYNRQLINWKLEDQIYREFVLNPLIDPARDGQLAWRRKLWEYFYLPMRKDNDPASAAQTVLRFLHQRVAIVPQGPATIDEMWQEKQADEHGIQALEVAAFRSVGVPARLDERGQAELFSDGKWQRLAESTTSAPQSIPVPVK